MAAVPSRVKDLTGLRIGQLTVVGYAGGQGHAKWLCRCDCGVEKEISSKYLTRKRPTKSCGCLVGVGRKSVGPVTHGLSDTPEYRAWINIKKRCLSDKDPSYPRYGGSGISIADEWINDFPAFYEHIGQRPSRKHSIDRIDNTRGYEPGNIRWATQEQQDFNRSNTVLITVDGVTRNTREWSKITGLSEKVLQMRRRLGWPDKDIISKPVNKIHYRSYVTEFATWLYDSGFLSTPDGLTIDDLIEEFTSNNE